MNEVRTICERMFEVPAPPLRDSATVLETARRSTARRARHRAVGVGLATVVAMVGTAVVVPPVLAGRHAPPASGVIAGADPETPTASQSPAGPVTLPATLPPARAAAQHSAQMERILLRALPAGHTGSVLPRSSDEPTVVYPNESTPRRDNSVIMPAGAAMRVTAGAGEGWLSATIMNDGKPAPTGDLCAVQVTERLMGQLERCQVIPVAGVPILVGTRSAPETGQSVVAIRFLTDGMLMLSVAQGIESHVPDTERPADRKGTPRRSPTDQAKPPLAAPLLTAAQAAALAGDPAMLQFP